VQGLCLRNHLSIGFGHSVLLQQILSPGWNHHFDTKRVEPGPFPFQPQRRRRANRLQFSLCPVEEQPLSPAFLQHDSAPNEMDENRGGKRPPPDLVAKSWIPECDW
jgi:hypothetical protein